MGIDEYMREACRYPLLTREEEISLGGRAQSGDRSAEDSLVCSNLRLVVSIARRYAKNGELLDLIQEGTLGLMTAARKYDPSEGNRFSSYAVWWIKDSILKSKIKSDIKRLPENQHTLRRRLFRCIVDHIQEHHEEPPKEALLKVLNDSKCPCRNSDYTKRELDELLEIYYSMKPVSLNQKVKGLDRDVELQDTFVSRDNSPESHYENAELRALLETHLKTLKPDLAAVVTKRFFQEKDLAEIAEEECIEKNTVKDRLKKALRVLKWSVSEDPKLKMDRETAD